MCQTKSRSLGSVPWSEIEKHNKREDRWIVVDNEIYDVTRWAYKHPGGSKLLNHYAGEDATEAFKAFHKDLNYVRKFMKPLHIGTVENPENEEIKRDFAELRKTAEDMGLFRPSVTFFILQVGQIVLFEILAYLIICNYGIGWLPWIASVLCFTIVQGQASWTQHDFGHLSVFKSTKLNNAFHQYLMCLTKGAGSDWWKHLHYQHHAKPNVLNKDPDVRLESLFVLGEDMPKRKAQEKSKMPYNWQNWYFFATLPPLLFPVYFQLMVFRHSWLRRKWLDLVTITSFFVKLFVFYSPYLGLWGTVKFYLAFRVLESHWFVWVSQSNHIPMEIREEQQRPWLSLQLHATCNIEKSAFNDWFTGHLNHQIEHHLFPTMPRHNLYKMSPLVKSLCKKHGINYVCKPLLTAFADIVRSLKHSGEIWQHYSEAYSLSEEHH